MNFDELKERFKSELSAFWEKVQDSSIYIQLQDIYENLSPSRQKIVIVTGAVLAAAIVLYYPYSFFMESMEAVDSFNSRRDLIAEVHEVAKDVQGVPQIQELPPLASFKGRIESELASAQVLPEQIKSVEITEGPVDGIAPNLLAGGLAVSVQKLNVRQVVNVGHQLHSMTDALKLYDMVATAHKQDTRYYDVTYKLIALNVPSTGTEDPDNGAPPPRRGRRN